MKRLEETSLPTKFGSFKMIAYDSGYKDFPHIALINKSSDNEVLDVRIHSECLTGDLFGSVRCDCGEQLDYSMDKFGRDGGCVLYLRQEGRGIGLINKMMAYNLQDEGMDTIAANHALGFETDERDFDIAIQMLLDMGVSKINLHTNNPNKVSVFDDSDIQVVNRMPVLIDPRKENKDYLKVKKEQMGHFFPDRA